MTLGEKLRSLRAERGWDQEALAERLDVSRQAVSKWELDKTVPEVKYIVAISELFGVTTDYLLKDAAGPEGPAAEAPPEQPPASPIRQAASEVLTDRGTGLPVWHAGLQACRALVLGDVAAAVLLGLYLYSYLSAFSQADSWPLLLTAVALPVLVVLGKLLLEGTEPPERVLRRFRRAVGAAAALWGLAIALLLGFGEVLDDTLLNRYSGPGGVLAGLLLTAGLPAACGLLGYALAGRLVRPSEE